MSKPFSFTPVQIREIRKQVRELMTSARIFGIPKGEWPDKILAKIRVGFGPNATYAEINAINSALDAEVRRIISDLS